MKLFDRSSMRYLPLAQRENKVSIAERSVDPERDSTPIPEALRERTAIMAEEILEAREKGASVIVAFGAHAIKNGLGRLFGDFARRGWVTHLATNGAGVIHDWEFAFQGASSEDVRANVGEGRFGTWEETGLFINLGLAVGAWRGLGYGESIGSMISRDGLEIPSREGLRATITAPFESSGLEPGKRAAACDLLELLEELGLPAGRLSIPHPFAEFSAQAAAFALGLPFTSHPMFGHDIIYTHSANRGAAVGRTAERDFLAFVSSVARLEGGVYLSVGSAVMSPMIFEKSLSMARNVSLQRGADIRDCKIHIVDLQEAGWDWSRGEPPISDPAYYLRFMKTFYRMGCPVDYTCADNRAFFVSLYRTLSALDGRSRVDEKSPAC
jgi:hypothetical protein